MKTEKPQNIYLPCGHRILLRERMVWRDNSHFVWRATLFHGTKRIADLGRVTSREHAIALAKDHLSYLAMQEEQNSNPVTL